MKKLIVNKSLERTFKTNKVVVEDGVKRRLSVKFGYSSTNSTTFSITFDMKRTTSFSNSARNDYSGGCCAETIKKHFPEYEFFTSMHLSGTQGEPLYPYLNTKYHYSNKEVFKRYCRISDSQLEEFDKVLQECYKENLDSTQAWTKAIDTYMFPLWKSQFEMLNKKLDEIEKENGY